MNKLSPNTKLSLDPATVQADLQEVIALLTGLNQIVPSAAATEVIAALQAAIDNAWLLQVLTTILEAAGVN